MDKRSGKRNGVLLFKGDEHKASFGLAAFQRDSNPPCWREKRILCTDKHSVPSPIASMRRYSPNETAAQFPEGLLCRKPENATSSTPRGSPRAQALWRRRRLLRRIGQWSPNKKYQRTITRTAADTLWIGGDNGWPNPFRGPFRYFNREMRGSASGRLLHNSMTACRRPRPGAATI